MIQVIIHTDSLGCSEVFQITRELRDLGYGCPAKVTHRAVTYHFSPENIPED